MVDRVRLSPLHLGVLVLELQLCRVNFELFHAVSKGRIHVMLPCYRNHLRVEMRDKFGHLLRRVSIRVHRHEDSLQIEEVSFFAFLYLVHRLGQFGQ